ncbi:sensor histidine kinase [Thermopolyspora sp. NPDC052614]|uniref:sensor histidine kinase n=1 Tax=Thermopolyspora sp. NPDC052614 TaxID=3155682 RepID=UPI0034408594
MRNWRVRTRLIALILVPTVAVVLIGGFQVASAMGAANDFQRVNQLAEFVDRVSALSHELEAERDLTAMHIARGHPEAEKPDVDAQMARVDGAAAAVRSSASVLQTNITGRTADEVATVINRVGDLSALRKQAMGKQLLPDAAFGQYSLIMDDLLSLYDELGKGSNDDVLFGGAIQLESFTKAKEALSRQRGLLAVVITAGRFEQKQMQDFLGALSDEEAERRAFTSEASRADRRFYDENVNGSVADRANFLRQLVLIRATSGASLKGLDLTRGKTDDAREWYTAVTKVIDGMRKVEERQMQAILARSADLEASERGSAFVLAGVVVAILVVVLLVTTGVAQSLVRPLRRLRSDALDVALRRLPEVVQKLRDSSTDAPPPDVAPIGIFSKDEIGEVARAFDEVHREAVRLAGDEARLRSNINAIFVNLSRRSQTLVERQLSLIERLEQGEENERRLADLFTLDHLATRMRRNSENLLVLAGQEAVRRRSEPVELMDVVRASLSEVENYERAVLRLQSEVALAGQAVNDVVHLLAELIENALWFSPADTKVFISSNRIDGSGVMISVTDQGIGMAPEELAQVNWRLADPPVVDVAASRRMGLFVVGRLALRHGIRVQLRTQDAGGLTAMVLIPESLVVPIPGTYPGMPQATHAGPTLHPGQSFQQGLPGPSFGPPGPAPLAGASSGMGGGVGGGMGGGMGGPMSGPSALPGAAAHSGAGPQTGDSFNLDRLRPFTPQEPPHLNAPWPGAETLDPPSEVGHGTSAWPELPPAQGGSGGFADRPSFQPVAPGRPGTGPQGGNGWGSSSSGDWGTSASGEWGAGAESSEGLRDKAQDKSQEKADEYLPIYAEVESNWFQRSTHTSGAESSGSSSSSSSSSSSGSSGSRTRKGDGSAAGWSSPADVGWRAAQSVAEPAKGGMTAGGLPKRVPKANLVPGTASVGAAPSAPQQRPRLSPDRMRSRLSSYQSGLRRGRDAIRREGAGAAADGGGSGGSNGSSGSGGEESAD